MPTISAFYGILIQMVLAALKDTNLFSQAYVYQGAVTWPGEIDLAPDAMHAAIRATGKWIPGA